MKDDADAMAGWLFAHDLSEYAGEWIAAVSPGRIIAHAPTLREVSKAVSSTGHLSGLRYYAVPGELQAT